MPTIQTDKTLTMFYEDHYFGEPWRNPETVLLIHGVAESSRAWFGWVPHLAKNLRVLRPDQRGFGQSTVPAPNFEWSAKTYAADLTRFLSALKVEAAHVVGAKFGGSIAYQFAAEYPERTRTLTVLSGPVRAKKTGGTMDLLSASGRIREVGVRTWAAETQRARLGSEVSEEQIAWWTEMMGRSNQRVCEEVAAAIPELDLSPILQKIKAPTLIITTERSALQSVETVRETQKQIPNSELLILPGDSYHIAAARPDECARHVLDFIGRKNPLAP
jgi:3-oxoadipate enol-lactonase